MIELENIPATFYCWVTFREENGIPVPSQRKMEGILVNP